MLVLSRQRDETIMIGDDVEITVVDVRGDKVRLGITAPSRVAVHRKEVYDAIKAENLQASGVDAGELDVMSIRPGAPRPASGCVAGLRAASPTPSATGRRRRA